MIILKGEDVFLVKEGTAVTIGKFDGIHRGHKRLIEDVLGYAKKKRSQIMCGYIYLS